MASMASMRWRRADAASGLRSGMRLVPSLTLLYAEVNFSNRLIRRGEGPDPIGPRDAAKGATLKLVSGGAH